MKCCCEHTEGFPEECECKKEIRYLTEAYGLLSEIYRASYGLSKISTESDAKKLLKDAITAYELWRNVEGRDFKYRHLRR